MLIPKAFQKYIENPNNIGSFTLKDIKVECQERCFHSLETVKTPVIFQYFKDLCFISLDKKIEEKEKEKFFTSKKNAAFVKDLEGQARKIVKLAIEKFKKNAPLSEVMNPDISTFQPNIMLADLTLLTEVLLEPELAKKIKSHADLAKLKLAMLSDEPFTAVEEKKIQRRITLFNQNTKKSDELVMRELIEMHNKHKDLHNYFLFLASKLNKDLDKVSLEDIDSSTNKKAFVVFKEAKKAQAERKRLLEIEKSFLPTTPPLKAQSKAKGKKKKNRHSPTAKQKEVLASQTTVENQSSVSKTPELSKSIFDQTIHFFPDKRITRWFLATSEGIKNFEDKVLTTIVFHYRSLSKGKIEQQRIYHRLPGVGRLMSLLPANLQKYSTAYQFFHNGSMKYGRCFSVTLSYGNTQQEGMIYIGIDGKRIYHAKFVPLKEDSSSDAAIPRDLCMPLDGCHDDADFAHETEWQMQGGYSFTVEEDETIVWSIADGSTSLEYLVQPLF